MKIIKIISGGQTGADIAGLQAARACNVETGGTAPYGYKTELGSNILLKTMYGLTESKSESYIPRTYQNVLHSDMTLWFGRTNSAGFKTTFKAIGMYKKDWHEVTDRLDIGDLLDWIEWYFGDQKIIINVAGNRKSGNPDIEETVYKYMVEFLNTSQKQL